jgi:hypothetical protein
MVKMPGFAFTLTALHGGALQIQFIAHKSTSDDFNVQLARRP